MARRLFCAAAILMAPGCATTTPAGVETVDGRYAPGGVSGEGGDRVIVAVRAFDSGGSVGVCAAVAPEMELFVGHDLVPAILQRLNVTLEGERVLRDLSGFPRVQGVQALDGATARCVIPDVAWRAEFTGARPRIEFAGGRIRVES